MIQKIQLIALFILVASSMWADPIYQVVIDTSSLAGSDGAIYFQFNPGVNSDLASINFTNFSITGPGALLATPSPVATGGATGGLDPLNLVIDNTGGNNDYLHFLTLGTSILFDVNFNLSPILTPGASGSIFSFAVTASDGFTPLLITDPNGYFLGDISYDELGAFTTNAYSDVVGATVVPEPSMWWILGISLGALGLAARRQSAKRRA